MMRILAIDTSSGACSVAIYDAETRQTLAAESQVMAHGHAEALAPMVERLMAGVEGGFASLDRMAVCVGPGSFTGIRIGLAMARAMGLALEVPVVGVSAFAAFAGPLLADLKPGVIAAVIDAKHGQVYFQLFESGGRPLFAPRVAKLRDAVRAIGGGPARLAGNAAALMAEEAQRGGVEFDASEGAAYPDIVAIARMGAVADPDASPARPLYVKAPDAHPSQGDAVARLDG